MAVVIWVLNCQVPVAGFEPSMFQIMSQVFHNCAAKTEISFTKLLMIIFQIHSKLCGYNLACHQQYITTGMRAI